MRNGRANDGIDTDSDGDTDRSSGNKRNSGLDGSGGRHLSSAINRSTGNSDINSNIGNQIGQTTDGNNNSNNGNRYMSGHYLGPRARWPDPINP